MSWERWRDWLDDAEDDFASAEELYRAGRYAKACFLAQQAAEKALKALLIKRQGRYERTHSVYSLAEAAGAPREVVEAGALLDRYYVPSRYPNAWPSGSPSKRLTKEDAERALGAAKAVLEYVRGAL